MKSNSYQRDQFKNYGQVPTANFLKYIGNSHAPLAVSLFILIFSGEIRI